MSYALKTLTHVLTALAPTFIMDSQIKTVILILLLLFTPSSSGRVKGFKGGEGPATSVSKVTTIMDMRELLKTDALLDYEKPGPNPRHEQGKGKPGNGGGGGGGGNNP